MCRDGLQKLLRKQAKLKAPLTVVDVPGDHFTSKATAIRMFLERVQAL